MTPQNLIVGLCSLLSLLVTSPASAVSIDDICKNTAFDFTTFEDTIWDYVEFVDTINGSKTVKQRHEYYFSFCKPLGLQRQVNDTNDSVNGVPPQCFDKRICFVAKEGNETKVVHGYGTENFIFTDSLNMFKLMVQGPACDKVPVMNRSVIIDFSCDADHGMGKPIKHFSAGCNTHFNWPSIAACKKKESKHMSKCYVYDQSGQEIDLSPLLKLTGAHRVEVPAEANGEKSETDFFINVCSEADHCNATGTAACSKEDGQPAMLGDIRMSSIAWDSYLNETVIRYNGTRTKKCPVPVQTIIRLHCPKDRHQTNYFGSASRKPFLVKNLVCEYEVEWETEFACPAKSLEAPASDCKFKSSSDPNFVIDLTPLKKTSLPYYQMENVTIDNKLSNETEQFNLTFNVCSGLVHDSANCGESSWNSSSVCLKSHDGKVKMIIGSMKESKLTYVDGQVILTYKTQSGTCSEGAYLSPQTVISFVCDPKVDVGSPTFMSYEECTYNIEWRTKLACPPAHATPPPCTLELDDGTMYDLSPLRKNPVEMPWQAVTSEYSQLSRYALRATESVFLNICGPLMKSNCSGLSSDIAICEHDYSRNTSRALGRFVEGPAFNNATNGLSIQYNVTNDEDRLIVSKINFHCKPGIYDSSPILMEKVTKKRMLNKETKKVVYGSYYEFEWHTGAACPLKIFSGNDCRVFDQYLGLNIDLNPLRDETHEFYSVDKGKYRYYLNICGPLKNTPCNGSNIGACQMDKSTRKTYITGKVNSTLTYWNGVLSLTYSDGAPYNDDAKTPRTTNIAFICDPSQVGTPLLVDEFNQTYFFKWYTKYACPNVQNHVPCVWDNGTHVVDLSELALPQGNHYYPTAKEVYYINVCRPTNAVRNDQPWCKPNSGICRQTIPASRSEPLSLGTPTEPPQHSFDGSISLFYRGGDVCPKDKTKTIASRIKFVCDPLNGRGEPVLKEYYENDCTYVFEWRTVLVCDPVGPTSMQEDCRFVDNRTGLVADLTSLKKGSKDSYEVSYNHMSNKGSFSLNICGNSKTFNEPNCKGAAVCRQLVVASKSSTVTHNYGLLDTATFSYDGVHLRLVHVNGSECSESDEGDHFSSEIVFKCNPYDTWRKPLLVDVFKCRAVFEWETQAVCDLKPKHPCTLLTDRHFYDLRLLSSSTHSWNTTDPATNQTFFLNLCHQVPSTVRCADKSSAICACGPGGHCDRGLGKVSTSKLVEDSDGNLVLNYKLGSVAACDTSFRGQARSQIVFKCGQTFGSPKFLRSHTNTTECLYIFEWTSFAACPQGFVEPQPLKVVRASLFDLYLVDEQLNASFNVSELFAKEFNVTGYNEHTGDIYNYKINLGSTVDHDGFNCNNASVCQTKVNDTFHRDIGAFNGEQFSLIGTELHIVLFSGNPSQKCGKNPAKNVTTTITLQCSSSADLGEPKFEYESNDCHYRFRWETERVCNFIPVAIQATNFGPSVNTPSKSAGSDDDSGSSTFGLVVVILIIVIACSLGIFVVMGADRRQQLISRMRSLLPSSAASPRLQYSQLATNDLNNPDQVAFISTIGSSSPYSSTTMTISSAKKERKISRESQSQLTVPFSMYDDQDIDLLT